ncbi:hypothetical protein FSP39_017280 [Pinctada imbricata]|uniref:Uncharacterized protein n=1 Tax=Pinctada imbricata TaxID=66713 RepID=A0AA89BNS7_PINIB|nr:hypothetical protein FSP39_017280 [Pinctada imbricata]
MATLVETPAEAKVREGVRKNSAVLQEVIHTKEAKFNEHGILHIKDAVIDKEHFEAVTRFNSFPEKDIIKHDIAKKSRAEVGKLKSESDGKTDGSLTRPVTVASDRDIWNDN